MHFYPASMNPNPVLIETLSQTSNGYVRHAFQGDSAVVDATAYGIAYGVNPDRMRRVMSALVSAALTDRDIGRCVVADNGPNNGYTLYVFVPDA